MHLSSAPAALAVVAVRAAVRSVPEIRQRRVQLGGVLPHIEPHGAEAERFDLAANRTDQTGGERGAPGRDEGVLDQLEVRDQGLGRRIAGRIGRDLPRSAAAIMTSSRRTMQARYWRNTSPGLRLAISSPLRWPPAPAPARCGILGHRHGPLRDAERPYQIPQPAPVAAQPGKPILQQRAAGDLVGDERISVPVATHPGAELKEGRDLELLAGVGVRQRPLQLVEQVGHRLEQRLIEEVQSPEDFLRHGRLGQAQLAGVQSSSISFCSPSTRACRSRGVQRGDSRSTSRR